MKSFASLFPAGGLLLALTAGAHTPSETFLTLALQGPHLTGRWDVALRDLHQGLGLDPGAVRALDPADLARREEALTLDVAHALRLAVDGRATELELTDYTTLPLNGIDYARVLFQAKAVERPPAVLEVDARSLFRIDTNMHGYFRLEHNGRAEAVAFGGRSAVHRFALTQPEGAGRRWLTFVWEGVWHIWIGFDHILFLVALLLPAVLRHGDGGWRGVEQFRPALLNVIKIVTAFTVAHSVTLSLAALGLVTLPARLVESAIALSVVLAAANNLRPWFGERGWMVAFGFGLVHGFGFANVLGELGLSGGLLAGALVGFNVGVELGQLTIVGAFLPAAYGLRRSWFYRKLVFKFGSALVILIATAWMVERVFDLSVLPRGEE